MPAASTMVTAPSSACPRQRPPVPVCARLATVSVAASRPARVSTNLFSPPCLPPFTAPLSFPKGQEVLNSRASMVLGGLKILSLASTVLNRDRDSGQLRRPAVGF